MTRIVSRRPDDDSAETARAEAAEGANSAAITSHVNSSTAHSAGHVTFTDSGLAVVQGASVQAALTAIDAWTQTRPTTESGPIASISADGARVDGSRYVATDGNNYRTYTMLAGHWKQTGAGTLDTPGVELFYAEVGADETTTATVNSAVAFSTADLTFALPNQPVPVLVHGHALVANSTATDGSGVLIGGATVATKYSRGQFTSSTVSSSCTVNAYKRFSANSGALTVRLYKYVFGGGTATFFGSLAPTFLRVVTQ